MAFSRGCMVPRWDSAYSCPEWSWYVGQGVKVEIVDGLCKKLNSKSVASSGRSFSIMPVDNLGLTDTHQENAEQETCQDPTCHGVGGRWHLIHSGITEQESIACAVECWSVSQKPLVTFHEKPRL